MAMSERVPTMKEVSGKSPKGRRTYCMNVSLKSETFA